MRETRKELNITVYTQRGRRRVLFRMHHVNHASLVSQDSDDSILFTRNFRGRVCLIQEKREEGLQKTDIKKWYEGSDEGKERRMFVPLKKLVIRQLFISSFLSEAGLSLSSLFVTFNIFMLTTPGISSVKGL